MATNARQTRTRAEVNKTVTVLAYLKCQDFDDERRVADWLDGGKDYAATRTETTTRRYFEIGSRRDRITDDEHWQELCDLNLGDGSAVKETVEKEYYVNSPSTAATGAFNHLIGDESIAAPNGCGWRLGNTRLRNGDYDTKARVRCSIEGQKMVKHPSQLDGAEETPYVVNSDEYWCLKAKFRIIEMPEATVERLERDWIKAYIQAVRDCDWFGRVRWVDCHTEVTEKGACYNI